jgi:hypothetical protein
MLYLLKPIVRWNKEKTMIMDKLLPLTVLKGIAGKAKGLLMMSTLFLVSLISFAQTTQVFNESTTPGSAGIRLRVWLHGVYSDANCTENAFSGANTKFVFTDLRVRAANGTNYILDNLPVQNLFLNPWAQTMTFRVKSNRVNRFWLTNDSEFRLLNPYYPFRASTVSLFNDTYIPAASSEAAPYAVGSGSPARVTGQQTPATQGFLMFDRQFSGNKLPDRYQWQLKDAFESDADFSADEAGGLNLFGAGCTRAFGLPQVYEGGKGAPYPPELVILLVDSIGATLVNWILAQGACTNLFRF